MKVSLSRHLLVLWLFFGWCHSVQGKEFEDLYFVITNFALSGQKGEKEFKIEDVDRFLDRKKIEANTITFHIKAEDRHVAALREIQAEIEAIKIKIERRERRYPGVAFNRDLPDGGVSGKIYLKNDTGKLVEFCSVSRLGNPVFDYNVIKMRDESKLIFDNMMYRFLLSDKVDISTQKELDK